MHIVLLVDDDPAILHILTQLLESEGYVVAAFDDSLDALEHARLAPPSLALVDMLMPRMSGRELIQRLRTELGDRMPIVAMSASTQREQVRDLTIQDFVAKPFDLDDLADRIAGLMSSNVYAPAGDDAPRTHPDHN